MPFRIYTVYMVKCFLGLRDVHNVQPGISHRVIPARGRQLYVLYTCACLCACSPVLDTKHGTRPESPDRGHQTGVTKPGSSDRGHQTGVIRPGSPDWGHVILGSSDQGHFFPDSLYKSSFINVIIVFISSLMCVKILF